MDKSVVNGLLFYYTNSADLDEGIREQTVEVLMNVLAKMNEEEAALAAKRKSPNKSGVVQVDPETGKVIAEYASQKEALIAIGKDPAKSGISDAINARTSTRKAYGYVWWFKDEWEAQKNKK